ncbi:MAG: phosphoenolpyruvate--protein phosphotransferase [Candidatus Neomarinimicrobiota bacterium]
MIKHDKINFLNGKSSSAGITIASAYVRKLDQKIIVPRTKISADMISDEMKKLEEARELVSQELELVRSKIEERLGKSYSDIISAQLAIVKDEELYREVQAYIEEHHVNMAYAFKLVINRYIEMFEEQNSEFFSERLEDIKDIKQRVLRAITSKKTMLSSFDLNESTIFVSRDLNPTDIVMLVSENVTGFITEFGGVTSHVAILARAMNVPMITGVKSALENIETGDRCILDGNSGKVFINPSEELLDEYRLEILELDKEDEIFISENEKQAQTRDGFTIKLGANISLPFEVKYVKRYGGKGIGLYRTEYFYLMKQSLPKEEELFQEYVQVVKGMEGMEVVIRTIDLGGDKMSSLIDQNIRNESNPFMGYRAIRICLDQPELFNTQLRAIFRASAFGKVSLLIPMITHIEELIESLDYIDQLKKELRKENIPFDENMKIGMMVETPSAVVNIEAFVKKVDFFSIGTNDLTQYTLAVDRGNEKVTNVYNHYDPAIIKMIFKVVEAAHAAQKEVFVCGEMATEAKAITLFSAMKVDGLSVAPQYIGIVRDLIIACDQKEAEKHLASILKMDTRKEIIDYLDKISRAIL